LDITEYNQKGSTVEFINSVNVEVKSMSFGSSDYIIFDEDSTLNVDTISISLNDDTGPILVKKGKKLSVDNEINVLFDSVDKTSKHTYYILRSDNADKIYNKFKAETTGRTDADYSNYRITSVCQVFVVYTNEDKPKCGNDPYNVKQKKTDPWWIFIIIVFLLIVIFIVIGVAIFFLVREKLIRKKNMKVFEKGAEVNDDDSKDSMSGESNGQSESESKESEDTENTGETEETEKSDEVTETKESEDRREKSESDETGDETGTETASESESETNEDNEDKEEEEE